MIIRIKLICLVVFSVTIGLSQKDSLFALGTNASLHNTLENKSDLAAKISSTTNLLPPFFDDFSTGGIYPNPQKWIGTYPNCSAVVAATTTAGAARYLRVNLKIIQDTGNIRRDLPVDPLTQAVGVKTSCWVPGLTQECS